MKTPEGHKRRGVYHKALRSADPWDRANRRIGGPRSRRTHTKFRRRKTLCTLHRLRVPHPMTCVSSNRSLKS